MQSIFRPAVRRETLGGQSEGGRRDGGLKWVGLNRWGVAYLWVLFVAAFSSEDPNGPKVVRARDPWDESRLL